MICEILSLTRSLQTMMMMEFKDSFLDYVERVWIHGNFPPKVWNHWKKPSNTTNNQNEGYNSRMNKLIAAVHPNPWILLCTIVGELMKAETEAIWIKAGNETKQVPSSRYRRFLKKREQLMGQFERSEISRKYYLKLMGGLCLKASKESDRLVNDPNLTVDAPVDRSWQS